MSLRKTVAQWNEAVILCQQGKYKESIDAFQQIVSPSAKFQYNIGCVHMILRQYTKAVKNFSDALGLDQFLAVGYFQRAIARFYLQQYTDAEKDFQLTKQNLRGGDLIDYQQLGLPFVLHLYQILHNLAVVHWKLGNKQSACDLLKESVCIRHQNGSKPTSHSSDIKEVELIEIPQDKSLFCPSKSLVDNLKKKDFLGKGKVISSVVEDDTFVGFEGKRKARSVPGSPVLSNPLARRPHTPPLHSTPHPPHLPSTPHPTLAPSQTHPQLTHSQPRHPSISTSIPSRPPPRLFVRTTDNDSCVSRTDSTSAKRKPPPPNRPPPPMMANYRSAAAI